MIEGKPKKHLARKLKIGAVSYASLMQRLVSDQATLHELVDHTGLHMQTIRDYIEALHKCRLIHIAAGFEHAPPASRAAAQWALDRLNATPTGQEIA